MLITGAARGIGAGTARALAARGASVSLVGLERAELEAVAASCGPNAVWFEADVRDQSAIDAAVAGTVRELGGIDVVMTSAGIASVGTVRTIDPAAFERTIDINLTGTFRTVRACLPHVIERRGYVLCVASLAAVSQAPLFGAYAASKAGVEAFANSLRTEIRHLGVDVGVAYYSWIATDMVTGGYAKPEYAELRERLKGPISKTHPVSAAVDGTVEGITRRSRHVVAPRWIRAMIAVRGILHVMTDRQAAAVAPELVRLAEDEVRERGAEAASEPVGAGGAAVTAAGGG